MIKKNVIVIVIIMIIEIFNPCCNIMAYNSKMNHKMKVLLVYDKESQLGDMSIELLGLNALLYRFDVEVNTIQENDYELNDIDEYEYIFVMGLEGEFKNSFFREEIRKTRKIVCWVGKGIELLLRDNEYDIEYKGMNSNIIGFYYGTKETELYKMKKFNLNYLENIPILDQKYKGNEGEVEIFSYLSDGRNMYPYILKNKNLWYISFMDPYTVSFYLLADILYEIFNVEPPKENQVYVRLEDIHLLRDINKLKAVAEYLHSENVPFMIALIPAYLDQETLNITTISDNAEFGETIRYLQELGGSVILHGYQHSIAGQFVTGEGYEFWNGLKDEPLDVNMEEWVYQKVGDGVTECIKNGIYPLGFEAPHYAADLRVYKELKKYFSTYIGRLQLNDTKYSVLQFPYNIYNSQRVNKLIPENLGYVKEEDGTLDKILENMDEISVVRGHMAGVYFHTYLDVEYIKKIVDELKDRGYSFYDMRKEEHWVKWENISITCKNEKFVVNGHIQENIKGINKSEAFYNINKFLNIIILIVCVIFSLIIYKLRKKFIK